MKRTAAYALPIALYLFVLWVCARPGTLAGPQTDYYNLLAHGFLKGHLYLDTPVPRELLQLPNPYDPAQRPQGLALHDTSLYHHHYYIYFGVIPLWLVMLPFRWLTHHDLPIAYAVWLFGSGTFAISLSLLSWLRRRHYPNAPAALWFACVLGLAFGGAELTLMVRASMYELPIASGACLFAGALACLCRGMDSPRPVPWALLGGLLVGLAAGCRPFYAFGIVLFFVGFRRRAAWAAVAPWAAVGCCLAWYNMARFGNPLEFGQHYQLSGAIEGQVRHFGLAYVPFNLRVYLLSALRWGRYFPFVRNAVPPPAPPGFGGWEFSYGLLPNLPFSWFAVAGLLLPIVPRLRADDQDPLLRRHCALLAAAAMAVFAVLCGFFGSVARYLGDFAPFFMLLAAVGLHELHHRAHARIGRRFVAAAGVALAAATTFIAFMAAFLLYGFFSSQSPRLFAACARLANYPVGLIELAVRRIGPLEVTATLPPELHRTEPLVTIGPDRETDGVWIERVAANQVRFSFAHGAAKDFELSPLVTLEPAAAHRFTVTFGALYPPDWHPFFFHASAGRRSSLKLWLSVRCDGREVWRIPTVSFEPEPSTLRIGALAGSTADVYTGRIVTVRTLPPPWGDDALPKRHLTFDLAPSPGWAGRSFPLYTKGRTLAGDALFLRVDDAASARIGYDHWSSPLAWSPAFAWQANRPQRLDVRVDPGPQSSLVRVTVTRDDVTLWEAVLPQFGGQDYAFFPGRNLTGATTCERVLPGATLMP